MCRCYTNTLLIYRRGLNIWSCGYPWGPGPTSWQRPRHDCITMIVTKVLCEISFIFFWHILAGILYEKVLPFCTHLFNKCGLLTLTSHSAFSDTTWYYRIWGIIYSCSDCPVLVSTQPCWLASRSLWSITVTFPTFGIASCSSLLLYFLTAVLELAISPSSRSLMCSFAFRLNHINSHGNVGHKLSSSGLTRLSRALRGTTNSSMFYYS